ncbi:MAG: PIN domain-containing protein [Nitrospirae bacterium]|nr:PIN domain-containing protein [Nitrospirota bacterium]
MKFVIDTNILISALLKKSVTREILLLDSFEFLLPEFALEEIEVHKDYISRRSGLNREELDVILSILLENIAIIPFSEIKSNLKKADKIMGGIDPLDAPFVALALSVVKRGDRSILLSFS